MFPKIMIPRRTPFIADLALLYLKISKLTVNYVSLYQTRFEFELIHRITGNVPYN